MYKAKSRRKPRIQRTILCKTCINKCKYFAKTNCDTYVAISDLKKFDRKLNSVK